MKKFDKRDVAVELLDAAVAEHLDHSRHFAAYNLAAVAEELFSKLLRCSRNSDATDLKIGMVRAMSKAFDQPEGEEKAWRKLFFRLKNTMKHMDGKSDRYFDANIETSARQKIGDAISNLERLGLGKSTEVRRFDVHRLNRHRHNAVQQPPGVRAPRAPDLQRQGASAQGLSGKRSTDAAASNVKKPP